MDELSPAEHLKRLRCPDCGAQLIRNMLTNLWVCKRCSRRVTPEEIRNAQRVDSVK